MTDTVNCIKCGAIIDRSAGQRILAMRQNDQELAVAHQWQCLDRERCKARGPIAQTAEQLRADLEAAQTVIEAQRRRIKRAEETEQELRHELGAAQLKIAEAARQGQPVELTEIGDAPDVSSFTIQIDDLCEMVEQLQAERDELDARFRLARHEIAELTHRLGQFGAQEKGHAWPLFPLNGEPNPEALATQIVRALEARVEGLEAERDELDLELAAERAAHRQTAADLSAQLTPARGPRAHIVTDKDL